MGRPVAVVVCLLVVLAGCASLGVAPPSPATDGPTAAGTPASTGPADTPTGSEPTGRRATVVAVVDGDTLDVEYTNGTTDRVRLLGVDTPEVHTDTDPAEFEGVPATDAGRACLRVTGENASAALRERIAGERVRVVTDPTADRRDRYGRLLAYVERGGTDLNRWLVAEGLARVYDSRFERSESYYAAESDAQSAGRGVWGCRTPGETAGDGGATASVATDGGTDAGGLVVAEMHADADGNDHGNLNGEYVVFANEGTEALAIGGWTVSDEAGHAYAFPEGDALGPGQRLTLYTGSGEDADGESGLTRYWGSDSAVWNNGGDAVTVTDGDGDVVLRRAYD